MLEAISGSRLTKELYDLWTKRKIEDVQFSQESELGKIEIPEIPTEKNLGILELPIEKLKKSNLFPYGITDNKLDLLKDQGYSSVGNLAEASNSDFYKIDGIGTETIKRIRSVLGQAIWM